MSLGGKGGSNEHTLTVGVNKMILVRSILNGLCGVGIDGENKWFTHTEC